MQFHAMAVSGPAYRDASGRIDPAAVRRLLEAGASLNVIRLEAYSNAVLRVSRALEAELRCPVQVNLYQTPGGGQGLGRHVDDHDVLVLQLEGEKHWQIFEAAGAEGTEERSAKLRAGNWLFLPRGTGHEVRNAGGEPSVHLTIGFHPLTRGAILDRALAAARAQSPFLNRPLDADPETAAAESPEDWLRELASFVEVRSETARHRRVFRSLAEAIPASEVPARRALDATDDETTFTWRREMVSSARTDLGLDLDLPYRRTPLRLYPDLAPSIERMAAVPAFRPRDLGAEDREGAALLARFLAGAGVLALA